MCFPPLLTFWFFPHEVQLQSGFSYNPVKTKPKQKKNLSWFSNFFWYCKILSIFFAFGTHLELAAVETV